MIRNLYRAAKMKRREREAIREVEFAVGAAYVQMVLTTIVHRRLSALGYLDQEDPFEYLRKG